MSEETAQLGERPKRVRSSWKRWFSATPARTATETNKWYVLIVITAIMTVNHIDRNVMNVIVEPVKHEFGLSDAAMGMLTGFAHSLAVALFVVPMGWLGDRVNRVRLMSVAVICWSALTGLGSLASSFSTLLLMRFGVGGAEAAGPPTSISLISNVFPAKQRPTAMGIYFLHLALGTAIIFLAGGWVAHEYGWRAAFLLAGAPGLLLGVLLLMTVREPKRERAPKTSVAAQPAPTLGEFTGMARHNQTLIFVVTAGTLATIAQTSVWAWMASFFMRTHGLGLVDIGILIAVVAGAAKGFGSLISGPLIRKMSGDRPRQLWRYAALTLCLSVPLAWAMISATTVTMSIASSIALGIVLGGWPPSTMLILVQGAPTRMRATSVGVHHFVANLIGAGCGPLITGAISDALGGDKAIGPALALTLSVNFAAAACYYIACRRLPNERPGES